MNYAGIQRKGPLCIAPPHGAVPAGNGPKTTTKMAGKRGNGCRNGGGNGEWEEDDDATKVQILFVRMLIKCCILKGMVGTFLG